MRTPDFSIFDPDGRLPLNLQRTGLTNLQLDFMIEAFAAQAKAALAKFILSAPPEPKLTEELFRLLIDVFEFDHAIPVFFTSSGTALLTATNLRVAKMSGSHRQASQCTADRRANNGDSCLAPI